MWKYWAIAVGAGLASALAFLFAGSGTLFGMLLTYFAQLPLFLVALSLGAPASMAASAAGVLTVVILAGGIFAGFAYVLFNAVPVFVFIRQALLNQTDQHGVVHWYPAGLLLGWLTAAGAALLTIAAVWLAVQPAGLEGTVTTYVETILEQVLPTNSQTGRDRLISRVIPILPGTVVVAWLIMAIVNSTLAQKMLIHFGHNLRPWPEIAALELPQWAPVLAVLSVLMWLLPGGFGYYGQNLMLVLLTPFFFVGLAVVHSLCRRMTVGGFVLFLFYFTLMALGWPVIVVTVLGFIENWYGLRRRLVASAPGSPGEEV
jgi:hypothetical protein